MATVRVEQEPRFVLELTEEEARCLLDALSPFALGGAYEDIYLALLDAWESQA